MMDGVIMNGKGVMGADKGVGPHNQNWGFL